MSRPLPLLTLSRIDNGACGPICGKRQKANQVEVTPGDLLSCRISESEESYWLVAVGNLAPVTNALVPDSTLAFFEQEQGHCYCAVCGDLLLFKDSYRPGEHNLCRACYLLVIEGDE